MTGDPHPAWIARIDELDEIIEETSDEKSSDLLCAQHRALVCRVFTTPPTTPEAALAIVQWLPRHLRQTGANEEDVAAILEGVGAVLERPS